MKEIKSILAAYDRLDHATQRAALATVVRVEGSSYRRTGARMLVVDDGTWVGGISGGCMEGDALKRARLAIARSKPSLVTYDTTEDDAHQIGVGLGCNGIIDVLLTPVLSGDPHSPISVLQEVVTDRRQTNVLLTITKLEDDLNGFGMGNIIRYADQESLHGLSEESLVERLEKDIQRVVENSKSAALSYLLDDNRELEIFAEFLPPELHVIIMGHQYDVFPLAKVIKEAGWRATLVANPQKIHREVAALVGAVVPPEEFSPKIIDNYSAVILMSHDYKTDKNNLPLVLSAPYIGMLGPRVRAERIFAELREAGVTISPEIEDCIFAPVGLDIGAITPEEITLSMVAEIRAVFSQREGGMLRERVATIHER